MPPSCQCDQMQNSEGGCETIHKLTTSQLTIIIEFARILLIEAHEPLEVSEVEVEEAQREVLALVFETGGVVDLPTPRVALPRAGERLRGAVHPLSGVQDQSAGKAQEQESCNRVIEVGVMRDLFRCIRSKMTSTSLVKFDRNEFLFSLPNELKQCIY